MSLRRDKRDCETLDSSTILLGVRIEDSRLLARQKSGSVDCCLEIWAASSPRGIRPHSGQMIWRQYRGVRSRSNSLYACRAGTIDTLGKTLRKTQSKSLNTRQPLHCRLAIPCFRLLGCCIYLPVYIYVYSLSRRAQIALKSFSSASSALFRLFSFLRLSLFLIFSPSF